MCFVEKFMIFFNPVLTDAIDKGDNRRLGKKPVFSSSQVLLLCSSILTFVLLLNGCCELKGLF